MPEVGVRELKAGASQILRDVRERRTRYIVTCRGEPVGLLLPLDERGPQASTGPETAEPAWDTLTRLGEEIGRDWRSPLTGAELLADMRR